MRPPARQTASMLSLIHIFLIGGEGEAEIPRMVELSRELPVEVRFIELMPIGECAHWPEGRFIPNTRVLEVVPELEPCGSSGVARLYSLPNAKGREMCIRDRARRKGRVRRDTLRHLLPGA